MLYLNRSTWIASLPFYLDQQQKKSFKNLQAQNQESQTTLAKINENFSKAKSSLPLGTVIDWYRFDEKSKVPDGFQICDGQEITDKKSPYFSQKTPNLINKFVMGVAL